MGKLPLDFQGVPQGEDHSAVAAQLAAPHRLPHGAAHPGALCPGGVAAWESEMAVGGRFWGGVWSRFGAVCGVLAGLQVWRA